MWKDLHEAGEHVSEKRFGRLMREEGLRARARKRFRSTTMSEHDQPVAGNVLARQFAADRPNQRWVSDTTEFVIGGSGKLYLAAILDLYSRFIVGWALSAVNDRHLTLRALEMALQRRCPEAGLLHHSDQGSTYASEDYRARLEQHGITCSMSRRGNCYDNAVIESWFATVKSEEGERFESYAHAKAALFDYIEVFYNQRRRTRRSARSARLNSSGATKRAWIPWKTAQDAVSHRLHTPRLFQHRKKRPRRPINSAKPSTESDQAHGGGEPVWSGDGRTLFFRGSGKMMSVAMDPSASELITGSPVGLFEDTYVPGHPLHPNYDVSPDGSRLLIVKSRSRNVCLKSAFFRAGRPSADSCNFQRNR